MSTKNAISSEAIADFLEALAKLVNHGNRFNAEFANGIDEILFDDDGVDTDDVRVIVTGPFRDRTLESVRIVWSPDSPNLVIDEIRHDDTATNARSFALDDRALLTEILGELHRKYGVSTFARRDDDRCPFVLTA